MKIDLNKQNDIDTFLSPHNLILNTSGYTNKAMLGRNVGYPIEEEGDGKIKIKNLNKNRRIS